MAFLVNDPNKDQSQGQNSGQSPGQDSGPVNGQAQVPLGSGSSGIIDSNPGGTGVTGQASQAGTGGSNAWTNIQNYLQANAGNTNSSKFLSDNASKVIGDESQNLTSQAKSASDQGQAQVDSQVGTDQASKLISDAAKAGQGSDPWNSTVSKIQGNLNSSYTAPSNFSYGPSSNFQSLSNGLNNDTQFQQYMDSLYNQNAGGEMTQGQQALQQQIDLDPTAAAALKGARSQAQSGVNDFNTNLTNTTANANTALANDQTLFGQNQQGLKDYLNTSGATDQTDLNNLVAQWNKQEQTIQAGNMPGDQYGSLNFLYGGTQNGVAGSDNIGENLGQYNVYRPGGTADTTNVTGGDNDRNQFNVISSILGNPEIASSKGPAIQHGTNNFDASSFADVLALINASEQAKGYTNQINPGFNTWGALTQAQNDNYQKTGVAPAGAFKAPNAPNQPVYGVRSSGGTNSYLNI